MIQTTRGTPTSLHPAQVGTLLAYDKQLPNPNPNPNPTPNPNPDPNPNQVGTLLVYDTQLPRPPGITDPKAVAGYAAG